MIETSPVFEKIKKLLDENGIAYQLFEHEPVYTSEQAAQIRNTKMCQGAKAIIFKADDKPVLIVVPGDRRVDTKIFKKLYYIKDLRLLTADEVKELTGLEIGAIPPFGSAINLKIYCDQAVFENEEIVFNAGAHTKSVKMKSKDFEILEKPAIGHFCV
ncbi:MAG: YbaK/EbsC family protein [bacterium]|nr:YbaK/EbsC family protein [bacterium]